ncbi:MAG: hypothetical protein ACRCXZ_04675 [Patescibacteria group bacterium]
MSINPLQANEDLDVIEFKKIFTTFKSDFERCTKQNKEYPSMQLVFNRVAANKMIEIVKKRSNKSITLRTIQNQFSLRNKNKTTWYKVAKIFKFLKPFIHSYVMFLMITLSLMFAIVYKTIVVGALFLSAFVLLFLLRISFAPIYSYVKRLAGVRHPHIGSIYYRLIDRTDDDGVITQIEALEFFVSDNEKFYKPNLELKYNVFVFENGTILGPNFKYFEHFCSIFE